ncbi:MAG: hypothetical protein LBV74_16255 [Tannerella sp.]|jgi:hypothetical protein|nr:hypothetical protein [Tannerella sp.]
MKTNVLFILLTLAFAAKAQDDQIFVCEDDRKFTSSCLLESRVFEPGTKFGFIENCTYGGSNSKLFLYDAMPQEITKSHLDDNGIPYKQLDNLILTVTGIENIPNKNGRRPFTFVVAKGNDGKKYRYYLSSPSDTIKPTTSGTGCIYLVKELEKFSKLIGRTLYLKNNLWSDKKADGKYETAWGMKYFPLEVTGITPASGLNLGAYYIRFKPKGSSKEYYRYCENSDNFFYSILTLCDPKDIFKEFNFSEKEWAAIQKGIPEAGMNKEILELCLGKPDGVSTHSTEKENQELWYYRNVLGKSYYIVLTEDKIESISTSEYNRR